MMSNINLADALQIITVIVSAFGVGLTVIWNRIVTRRKSTIDLILLEQTDYHLLEIRRDYLDIIRSNRIMEFVDHDKWFTTEAFPIVSTLNRYEIIAIGMKRGTIDKNIYRMYWRKTLVMDWIRCKSFVTVSRKNFNYPGFLKNSK